MVAPLPDGKAWKDFAPSKIDQRKAALETYLQSLQVAPLSDKADLCEFLSTDPVQVKAAGARKEGYLTKKGKNFGGWKTRYFVLDGPVMEYFESVSHSSFTYVMRVAEHPARRPTPWLHHHHKCSDRPAESAERIFGRAGLPARLPNHRAGQEGNTDSARPLRSQRHGSR